MPPSVATSTRSRAALVSVATSRIVLEPTSEIGVDQVIAEVEALESAGQAVPTAASLEASDGPGDDAEV